MRRGEEEELWMRRRTANWISCAEEERIFWHWHHGADDPPPSSLFALLAMSETGPGILPRKKIYKKKECTYSKYQAQSWGKKDREYQENPCVERKVASVQYKIL